MADLYRENILEHYKNPRNRGRLRGATSCAEGSNPFCGDEISFCIRAREGKLADVGFEGSACAICTASASMLSEEVKGKSLAKARRFPKERLLGLIGIDPGPTRLKCALLPLKAMKLAVYKELGRGKEGGKLV